MTATNIIAKRKPSWAWAWMAYTGFLFIEPVIEPSLRIWIVSLAAFAIFLCIFAAYVSASTERKPIRFWMIASTFVLGLVTFPLNPGASTFFVYTAAFIPFSVRPVRRVLSLYLLESGMIFAEGYFFGFNVHHGVLHIGWQNTFIAIFLVLVVGGGNIFVAEQKRADSKLRMAHEEIEQLAALAERERIARDLHDVLGHTLSVIVLKAELAFRLLQDTPARDPTRAATEIADVERTARTALTEVREAIGGYRAKGLAAELELARNTLSSAGVTLSCESPIPRLNAAEETVLALAVREAVTNIVRHARAHVCRMRFATTPAGFHSLQVEDDGEGILESREHTEGNGLRGMRERVHSLGGRLSITNGSSHSGTTLTIELPVASTPAIAPSCATA